MQLVFALLSLSGKQERGDPSIRGGSLDEDAENEAAIK
jgi:hypothetical protein